MSAAVLEFPTPAPNNWMMRERNRARIEAHRNGRNFKSRDDLTMDHADPVLIDSKYGLYEVALDNGMPSDSPYHTPAHDGA